MLKRIGNLMKGALGLSVSNVERRNPAMLLEVEKENLQKEIGKFNQELASHAGLCERLMAQVRKLESEQQELQARTSAYLTMGNRELAGDYALRLQHVTRDLGETRRQLSAAEETYSTLIKQRNVAVEAARSKIESLRQSIDDLKVKKAMAEISEMASGMVGTIGGSGDTLSRLHDMVEEEHAKAAGRIRVARDSMSVTDLELKEAEQKALANQALAQFEAQQNALPASAAAAPAAQLTTGEVHRSTINDQ